jgi:predicted HicB family RNase H-like nuclease
MPEKQIHIRLPEELHRELRLHCAYQDTTMQDYVQDLIGEQLTRISHELLDAA